MSLSNYKCMSLRNGPRNFWAGSLGYKGTKIRPEKCIKLDGFINLGGQSDGRRLYSTFQSTSESDGEHFKSSKSNSLSSDGFRLGNALKVLYSRSMVAQCSDGAALERKLDESVSCCYTGFDPTAKSLHVGNLLTIIALLHFIRCGHRAIALIGGATGAIGDPSGKSRDRIALESDIVDSNASSIHSQLDRVFRNATLYLKKRNLLHAKRFQDVDQPVEIKNNIDWIGNMNLLTFLSIVGRKFRVGNMVTLSSINPTHSSSSLPKTVLERD